MLDECLTSTNNDFDEMSVPDDENQHETIKHGEFLIDQAAITQGWKVMRSSMKISNGIDSHNYNEKSKKKKKKKKIKKKQDIGDVIHSSGLEEYVNGLLNTPAQAECSPKRSPVRHHSLTSPPATPNTQASNLLRLLRDNDDSYFQLQSTEALQSPIPLQDIALSVPPHHPIYQPQEGDIMKCSLPPKYFDKLLVSSISIFQHLARHIWILCVHHLHVL